MKNTDLCSIHVKVGRELLEKLRIVATKDGRSLGNYLNHVLFKQATKGVDLCQKTEEVATSCPQVAPASVAESPLRFERTFVPVPAPSPEPSPKPLSSAQDDALIRKYGCKTWLELIDLWHQGMIDGPCPERTLST